MNIFTIAGRSTAILLIVVMGILSACKDGSSRDSDNLAVVMDDGPPFQSSLALLKEEQIDDRLVELTFQTDALAAPAGVRVLLPADYAGSDRHYPVLYLLHGAWDHYPSWTDRGDARNLTEGLPLIVVMPEAGAFGFYSDWYNHGAGGPPQWETFHIEQLMPWIDHRYRTLAKREGRAVAGLSMGGFGTMSYAARHPDLFVAAASFSGAVDTNKGALGEMEIVGGEDGVSVGAIWGHRVTDEVRWRAHNPWDLAANLRGLQLTLRTGNGLPGGPYENGLGDPVELAVWMQSTSLHERLTELGIEHLWDDYGPGSHSWAYWQRSLAQTLPDLMSAFANPPAAPTPFSFTAVEPTYRVYGWTVQLQRSVLEFSRLEGADARGFRLKGSGTAQVVTADYYMPGVKYRVTTNGPYDSAITVLTADAGGRLTIPLVLGPDNSYQQYTAGAQIVGTQTYTVEVDIDAVPSE